MKMKEKKEEKKEENVMVNEGRKRQRKTGEIKRENGKYKSKINLK